MLLFRSKFQLAYHIQRIGDVQIANIHNGEAIDCHCQHHWFEPRTLAGRTLTLSHEALDIFAHKLTIGLAMATLKIRDNPFVGRIVIAITAEVNAIFLLACAIQHFLHNIIT